MARLASRTGACGASSTTHGGGSSVRGAIGGPFALAVQCRHHRPAPMPGRRRSLADARGEIPSRISPGSIYAYLRARRISSSLFSHTGQTRHWIARADIIKMSS
jgi:hypothetical protein